MKFASVKLMFLMILALYSVSALKRKILSKASPDDDKKVAAPAHITITNPSLKLKSDQEIKSVKPIQWDCQNVDDIIPQLESVFGLQGVSKDSALPYLVLLFYNGLVECPDGTGQYSQFSAKDNVAPSTPSSPSTTPSTPSGNVPSLPSDPTDPKANCDNYDSARNVCTTCAHAFFLDKARNVCVYTCPVGTFANGVSRVCDTTKQEDALYVKPFSKESCLNRCGQTLSTCSCCPESATSNQLCSDYIGPKVQCEASFAYSLSLDDGCSAKIANCAICRKSGSEHRCVNCKPNYFLVIADSTDADPATSCQASCPNTHRAKPNDICVPKGNCQLSNCEKCNAQDKTVCDLCDLGYFWNSELKACSNRCKGKYADLVTRKCVNSSTCDERVVIYSDKSSRKSCYNKLNETRATNGECGCVGSDNCQEYGNCCGDVSGLCKAGTTRKLSKKGDKGDNDDLIAKLKQTFINSGLLDNKNASKRTQKKK